MHPPTRRGAWWGKAPQLRLFSCLDSQCSPFKTIDSQRGPSRMWGGFKGFPHTITYSTLHFKQFQDDLVKKKKKKKKKIGVGMILTLSRPLDVPVRPTQLG